jgi:SH3-like domain-containing protein
MRRRIAISALLLHLSPAAVPAQAAGQARLDTPSGYPVPRFVSLKDEETNCRIGPSFDHPVKFIFKRAGAPVMVIAESVDHWRKIKDPDGDACWVHQTTLKAQSHVLVIAETPLHRRPDDRAKTNAMLGPGVLARLVKRKDGWLLVAADDIRGWTGEANVWGGAVGAETP